MLRPSRSTRTSPLTRRSLRTTPRPISGWFATWSLLRVSSRRQTHFRFSRNLRRSASAAGFPCRHVRNGFGIRFSPNRRTFSSTRFLCGLSPVGSHRFDSPCFRRVRSCYRHHFGAFFPDHVGRPDMVSRPGVYVPHLVRFRDGLLHLVCFVSRHEDKTFSGSPRSFGIVRSLPISLVGMSGTVSGACSLRIYRLYFGLPPLSPIHRLRIGFASSFPRRRGSRPCPLAATAKLLVLRRIRCRLPKSLDPV